MFNIKFSSNQECFISSERLRSSTTLSTKNDSYVAQDRYSKRWDSKISTVHLCHTDHTRLRWCVYSEGDDASCFPEWVVAWGWNFFFLLLSFSMQKNIFLESNMESGSRWNTDCLWGIKWNELKKESGARDWKRKHYINQLAVVLDQQATARNGTLN